MSRTTTFASAALVGLAILSFAGYSPPAAADALKQAGAETVFMLGTNPSRHLFITPAGQTFAVPTGPLAPGTRTLAFESLKEDGAAVGSDLEQCTMSFSLTALCDDTVTLLGRGQLVVSYTLQWPSTGASGPSSWSGPVIGGTGAYNGALGVGQATANPVGDRLTATFTTRTSWGSGLWIL